MTLRFRIAAIMLVALAGTALAVACSQESTASIVSTQNAQNKLDNTATARAGTIAAGGDPDAAGGIDVNSDSAAAQARLTFYATRTAIAQGIGPTSTPTPAPQEIVVPDGPALTDADDPTVNILADSFDPEVILVKAGTTVTWLNDRRSASSVKSLDGETEVFDSGPISKKTFDPNPAMFTYTFTIAGCHKYASFYGTNSQGAVCVEE